MPRPETKGEKLTVRLTHSAKRVLEMAATANGQSVAEFVLDSALAQAEAILCRTAAVLASTPSSGRSLRQRWTLLRRPRRGLRSC